MSQPRDTEILEAITVQLTAIIVLLTSIETNTGS